VDEFSVGAIVESFGNVVHDRTSGTLDLVAQTKILCKFAFSVNRKPNFQLAPLLREYFKSLNLHFSSPSTTATRRVYSVEDVTVRNPADTGQRD
jgi:hypothetical protein